LNANERIEGQVSRLSFDDETKKKLKTREVKGAY